MPAAIETHDLTRRFGDHLAVDRISMTVPECSIYGFLGRNGAGKTTTIRLLLGLLRPDAGTVHIAGINVASDRIEAGRNIGALLETQGLYPHLSGRDNLDLCRRLLGLPAAEIDRVLELVDMTAHGRRRVADYSLGMRQRLGVARAMLGAPPILILDEPTNGLDPEGIAEMRAFLRELPARTGATVLLSSHILSEIEQIATHVGIVSHGRLVLEGSLAELKADLATEVVIATASLESAVIVAREHGFSVERTVDSLTARFAPREDACRGAAALNHALCVAGIPVHAMVPRQHTLETLYRNATRETASAATPWNPAQ